jgi:hypothetical protein
MKQDPPGNLDHLTPDARDFVEHSIEFARYQVRQPSGLIPFVTAFCPPGQEILYFPMPFENDEQKSRMVRVVKVLIRAVDPQPLLTITMSEAWTLPDGLVARHHKKHRRMPMPSEHEERIEILMVTVETPSTLITGTAEIMTRIEGGESVRFFEGLTWTPLITATSELRVGGQMTGFLFHEKTTTEQPRRR